jgi:hypothetical protein
MTVTQEVITFLEGVRRRLTPPSAWTQAAYARRVSGISCTGADRAASCWCLLGAIDAERHATATRSLVSQLATSAVTKTVKVRDAGLTLAGWQDAPERTHEDILAAIDATLARLRAPETVGAAS